MVGRTVHQYQFLEKLGSGGMGDIYKAQDTRLGRFVAIKVLTHSATGDPERRKRFIQEAQAASALNHPNIITIHDIVSEDGSEYMVMEYVAGKTLVDLIPKGGLRVPQALKYAVQMADALQTAHAAGIVHRDLKPANVMVTESGLVKILDFGLAKLTDRGPLSQMSAGPSDVTQTIQEAPLTVEGSIIGTVSYMSPEQAQGKKVDTRSDIFSFGVVLYEMVTGVRAFSGESALSTLSAILRDDVRPIAETAPDVPPQFEMVISRCLKKQPDDRLQTMKDVQMALAALKHESDSGMLYRARLSEIQPPAVAAQAAAKAAVAKPAATPAAAKPPASDVAKKGLPAAAIAGILAAVLVIGGGIGGGLWWKHHKQVLQEAADRAAADAAAAAQAAQQQAAATPPPVETPPADATPAPPPAEVMTNDTVVELVKNKVSPTLIMGEIRAAKSTNFTFGATELIRLTKAGVPDMVVEQMRNPKRVPPAQPPAGKDAKAVAVNLPPKDATPPPPTPQPPPPQPVQQPAPATPPQAAKSTPPPPTNSSPAAAARPAVLPSVNITIPDGTPFGMTLAQDVPESVTEGTAIRFTVDKEVRVQDTVVIAKGASVTGVITGTSGKKLGVFGGGKVLMKLDEVDGVGGHKISVHLQRSGDATRPVEIKTRKSKDIVAAAGTDGYVAYINGTQTIAVSK